MARGSDGKPYPPVVHRKSDTFFTQQTISLKLAVSGTFEVDCMRLATRQRRGALWAKATKNAKKPQSQRFESCRKA